MGLLKVTLLLLDKTMEIFLPVIKDKTCKVRKRLKYSLVNPVSRVEHKVKLEELGKMIKGL